MAAYKIVRAKNVGEPVGFENGKPIYLEKHRIIKRDNSKSKLNGWWNDSKESLEKGKYYLLREFKNYDKVVWEEDL